MSWLAEIDDGKTPSLFFETLGSKIQIYFAEIEAGGC